MDNDYLPSTVELLQLVKDILSGNNEKITLGTQFLKHYTKKAQCLPVLLELVQNNSELEVRQFCVVLLKRHMTQLYQKIDEGAQTSIKQILLERFFLENSNNIKNSIGAVIGQVASISVADEKWPQLLAVISEKTMEGNEVDNRKSGLELLGHLIESSGSYLDNYYAQFMTLFLCTIQRDQDKSIRKQTVKNMTYLFENLDDFRKSEKEQAKGLVQPMLEVLMECLRENDEELGVQTLDSLQSVVESSSLLDAYLSVIIAQVKDVSLLTNRHIAMPLRTGVLDFVMAIVEHKRKFFNKQPQEVKALLESLIEVVNSPILEEDLQDSSETIQDIALHLLENMALHLHRRHIYPHVLSCVHQLVHSQNNNQICTGMLVLASIVEGCAQSLRKDLDKVMTDYVKIGLASEAQEVRGPTIKVLCQLSEYLSPDILVYHQAIVQGLVNNINLEAGDSHHKLNEKALIALDVIIENMEKEQIVQHLQPVMQKIMGIIQSSSSSGFMKQLAMSCVGSCVAAAGITFQQYAQELSIFLQQIVSHAVSMDKLDEDQTSLVCETVLVLGRISFYVCRDADDKSNHTPLNQDLYKQCIFPVMENVYTLLKRQDQCNLRESALGFFYNVADSIGSDFSILLDQITEIALEIGESQKGVDYVKDKKKEDFSLDTDSEDETKSGRVVNVKIGYMDEKASAIYALGAFAKACPSAFKKHWPRVLAILDDNYQQFYDNIRVQTVNCYMNLALAMVKADNNDLMPSKAQRDTILLSPQTQEYLQIELMTKFLYYLGEDSSSEVVCQALEALEQLITKIGRQFVSHSLSQLTQELLFLLKGKSKCLNEPEGEEDPEDVKEDVFEIITDIIPALVKVMKNDFNPHFDTLFKTMQSFLKTDNEINLVLQMIGCIAESFQNNSLLVTSYGQPMVEFLLTHAISFEDDEVLRNSAFCLGVMCEKNSLAMQQYQSNIIAHLKQSAAAATSPESKENILAAMCRIVMGGNADQSLIDSLVTDLFANVPFVSDLEEYKTILRFYIYLCASQSQVAQTYLDKIVIGMVMAIEGQKKYVLSDKFITKVVEKIKLLVANSQQAKATVQNYVLSIQDQTAKAKVIALL